MHLHVELARNDDLMTSDQRRPGGRGTEKGARWEAGSRSGCQAKCLSFPLGHWNFALSTVGISAEDCAAARAFLKTWTRGRVEQEVDVREAAA